ncbi:MAG: undecaprenyl-diphosphate phosphatase [Planctomycetota bacterium]
MNLPFGMLAAFVEGAAGDGSSWFGVAVLGVLQGLTEFLPVSSSGHLSLAGALLERSGNAVPEAGLHLTIVLHLGTLVAVAAVYGKDLLAIAREALTGKPRRLLLVAVGSVPAGVIGVAFGDRFDALASNPSVAATCLLVTAGLLLAGERSRRDAEASGRTGRPIGVLDAVLIGVAQAVALLPGVSRSGSTIATGMMRGIDPAESARFSFLLGFVAIAGAAALKVPEALADESVDLGRLAVGFVLSAVVGVAALRLLLLMVARGAFLWFALYCAAVGTAWLVLFSPVR